jgi:uncharacterized protein YdeI (YjbR/CyaY-like superfamily)
LPTRDDLPELHLPDRAAWRDWLAENHAASPGLWLVSFKKHTGRPRVAYDDAVEEAICFGWIDSTVRRLDDQRYCQMFVPRRPGSQWSGHNRRRAEAMIAAGLMAPAGLAAVDQARANGAWDRALDDHHERPVPDELAAALKADRQAAAAFRRLAPGQRRLVINHVAEAKQVTTRERRAAKMAGLLRGGWKPGM